MLQSLITDAIVLLAAGWLVWTFAPQSLRSMIQRRSTAPSYDLALQADELAGQSLSGQGLKGQSLTGQAPGEADCGCGDKSCH